MLPDIALPVIQVRLKYEPDTVILTIQDNGIGFDPLIQHAGIGLSSMRERAEVPGGSYTLESAPDEGTKIVVMLPSGNKEINDAGSN